MHQFKIEVYAYNKNGSVGDIVTTCYADNPEQARLLCTEYEKKYQMDEDGNPTTMKAYHVRLHILCYKLCQDWAAFFAQFQA